MVLSILLPFVVVTVLAIWTTWVTISTATGKQALRALTKDAKRAKSLVVICGRCRMLEAAGKKRELVDNLIHTLRERHQKGEATFTLWTRESLPEELLALQREQVITVHPLPPGFNFAGRVIDGRTVHRYSNPNSNLYSPGDYVRSAAPYEAQRLLADLERASAVNREAA